MIFPDRPVDIPVGRRDPHWPGGTAFFAQTIEHYGRFPGDSGRRRGLAHGGGSGSKRFQFFNFFIGFGDQLFEADPPIIKLSDHAPGGLFQIREHGMDFGGDLADIQGAGDFAG